MLHKQICLALLLTLNCSRIKFEALKWSLSKKEELMHYWKPRRPQLPHHESDVRSRKTSVLHALQEAVWHVKGVAEAALIIQCSSILRFVFNEQEEEMTPSDSSSENVTLPSFNVIFHRESQMIFITSCCHFQSCGTIPWNSYSYSRVGLKPVHTLRSDTKCVRSSSDSDWCPWWGVNQWVSQV